jgi:hypothetical protein
VRDYIALGSSSESKSQSGAKIRRVASRGKHPRLLDGFGFLSRLLGLIRYVFGVAILIKGFLVFVLV